MIEIILTALCVMGGIMGIFFFILGIFTFCVIMEHGRGKFVRMLDKMRLSEL